MKKGQNCTKVSLRGNLHAFIKEQEDPETNVKYDCKHNAKNEVKCDDIKYVNNEVESKNDAEKVVEIKWDKKRDVVMMNVNGSIKQAVNLDHEMC